MEQADPTSSVAPPEAIAGVADMYLLAARADASALKPVIDQILSSAPLRHMQTTRGFVMAAAMSSCGDVGWVSDRKGYRYAPTDPQSGNAWPSMPAELRELACLAARQCGFQSFQPDTCLINRYAAGKGMSAHQDKDEADFSQPIVSVSLGLPVRFFVQGATGRGKSVPLDLVSGDVVVWGGRSRLYYHGVRPLKPGHDADYGKFRFNLTFRKAL